MSGLKKNMGAIQRAVQMLAGTYDKDLLSFEVAKIISVDTANWLCEAQLVSGTVQTTYSDIQLTAEKASNGFIQVPKVGSNVILAITWRNEVYVFMCSEVDALVFHQKNPDGSYEEFVINCNNGFNPALPSGIQIIDGGGNGVVISSGTGSVTNGSDGIVISNSSSPPANGSKGILISCSGKMQFNDGTYNGLLIGANTAKHFNNIETDLNNLKSYLKILSSALSTDGSATLTGASLAGAMGALLTTYPIATITLTAESDLESTDIMHGPSVS